MTGIGLVTVPMLHGDHVTNTSRLQYGQLSTPALHIIIASYIVWKKICQLRSQKLC